MSHELLTWALRYAAKGWRVFPLHSIANGRCTCGKQCGSQGKHPRIKRGLRAASGEEAQIRAWWSKWPTANIGLATGSGLVVIDVDGLAGAAELKALVAANDPLPATLVSKTGNGFHLFFAHEGPPEVRNSARGNVHVRGEGGYVVAPPSLHHSGNLYRWIKQDSLAKLPQWLRQWSQGYDRPAKTVELLHGNARLPEHLVRTNQKLVGDLLSNSLAAQWSVEEQARLASALAVIPADAYETWFTVGMALQSLHWETNESDVGFELWDRWSQSCPAKYSPAICEEKWKTFGRSREGVSVGTVYHLARQHGWTGGAPPSPFDPAVRQKPADGHVNGANGQSYALPSELTSGQPIHFPDVTEDGKRKSTMENTKMAIRLLGVNCSKDLFHNRFLLNGQMMQQFGVAELADDSVTMLRDVIRTRYGFDPKKENVQDACETLCLAQCFDPVLDYLDSLQWDGRARLDRWMVDYLGAEDSDLARAIGRLVLVAAVRRAREPGTKFDQILVLESTEGRGKSTAIEILAGSDNFSDQRILDKDERAQQELVEGVWLYEIGDLTGMRRAEIEHVKAFASRKEDRARPAYGRYLRKQPRRCIFIGTTNQSDYLVSDTGNRRFWPVRTGRIDLDGLRRDRDQIWAEAAELEARGISITLPERLWTEAARHQEERRQIDAWLEPVSNYIETKGLSQFILTDLIGGSLQLQTAQIGYREQQRVVSILRQLGFHKAQRRIEGRPKWVYVREGA